MTRKSRILAIVSAALFVCNATRGSQSVSLAWDANTNRATAGYMLEYGAVSHTYTSQVNVGTNTVVTLSGLNAGQTYYFAVCAYTSAAVEGMLSSEASFTAPTNTTVSTNTTTPPQIGFVVTPTSGTVGMAVDVYGTNLNAASSVTFNGVAASFTVISNTVLVATIPWGATSGPLTVTTSSGTMTSQFTVVAPAGPANDNFANAQTLIGPTAFAWMDTVLATKEPGEPNHAGNSGGASVWYRWTAPSNGLFSLDTEGTAFSPLIAVYTGTSVSRLSVVASNANPALGPLDFEAAAGVTYSIAVDGFDGASGAMELRLSPAVFPITIFTDTFETTGGVTSGLPLAGQNGWISTVPQLSGVTANYFPGYGQQGYLGFSSIALASNSVALSHPLNFTVDTNSEPLIELSVLLQVYNPINAYRSSFGWVFRNTAGQELFSVLFDDATGYITYTLDDGAGQRSAGVTFGTGSFSQLVIAADFSRNQWSATLNGATIIAGQPITTLRAPLSLGDIAAKAVYPGLQSGDDGMFFDNYAVTASPEPPPHILLAPQNESVTTGSDLVLGVIASGAQPLSYQWYFNNSAIPGATGAGLWIYNATAADAGNYTVTAANVYGSVSANATVSVATPQANALLAMPVSLGINGRMLNFNVTSGHSYHVQASTNLTTWSSVAGFYAYGSSASYIDTAATAYSRRFYRVVSP